MINDYFINTWKFYVKLLDIYENSQKSKKILEIKNSDNHSLDLFSDQSVVIKEIKNSSFKITPCLTSICLLNKSIEIIEPFVFNSLKFIKIINLSGNSLNSLPHEIFRGLFNLKILDLSFNCLKSLNFLNDLKCL